jgi:hypothetical protein
LLSVLAALSFVSSLYADGVNLELTIKDARAISQKEGTIGDKAAAITVGVTLTNETKNTIGVGFSGMKFALFDDAGAAVERLVNDAEASGVVDVRAVPPRRSVTLYGTLTLVSNQVDPEKTYKLTVETNGASASVPCEFKKARKDPK